MNDELKRAIAEELEVDPDQLTAEKLLSDIEAWSSVTALTIMVLLGDELGILFYPGEIKELETFGDMEELVIRKQQQLQNK